MTNFWQNLKRFPTFIISVLIGLVVVIITPIIKRNNPKKSQNLLLILFFILIISISFTLKTMLQLN